MFKPLFFYSLILILLLSACRHHDDVGIDYTARGTASGRPEVTVNMSPDEAIARISEICLNRPSIIQETSERHVLCFKPFTDNRNAAWLIFNYGSYATADGTHVRFSIIKLGENELRIQGYQWIQVQGAHGQTKQVELNEDSHFNSLQNLLNSLKNY